MRVRGWNNGSECSRLNCSADQYYVGIPELKFLLTLAGQHFLERKGGESCGEGTVARWRRSERVHVR